MKKLLIILASFALLFGCETPPIEDEVIIEGDIELSSGAINFLNNGSCAPNSNHITITSTDEWILSGKTTTWCTPSVKSGNNGDVVVFTVEPNISEDDRELVYDFICNNKSARLVVKQNRTLASEIGRTEYSFTKDGGTMSVFLKGETLPSLNFSDDTDSWVTVKAPSQPTPDGYRWWPFEVKANDTYFDRDGQIIFNKDKDDEMRVNIEQTRTYALLPVTDKTVPIQVADITEDYIYVDMKSNIDEYSFVRGNGITWLSLDSVEELDGHDLPAKRFKIKVDEALGFRQGTFSIYANEPIVVSHTFTVNQNNLTPDLIDIKTVVFRNWLEQYRDEYVIKHGDLYELTDAGVKLKSVPLAGQRLTSLPSTLCEDVANHFHYITTFAVPQNFLTEIDISSLDQIEEVVCYGNAVSILKLGNNPVKSIDFKTTHMHLDNGGMGPPAYSASFTVSGKYLESINIDDSNYGTYDTLRDIDISECPALKTLSCRRVSGAPLTILLKTGQNVPEIVAAGPYVIEYK